jgi:pseudaminic acid synthase
MKIISMSKYLSKKPFIIAEMSGNHNQSLGRALEIAEAAADAGVDAVKLQTYTADTMTIDLKKKDFVIHDNKSLWKGDNLYALYKKAYTPWEWHKTIFERCKKLGIIGFSTPFDETAVDFLESLHVPFYKIASFESNHFPLLKKIARTGKPVIMSTGTSTLTKLSEAVGVLRDNGCKELVLLKCTSAYPSDPKESNILTIPHMRQLFGCNVGLSDHTLGIGVAIASIALGASVIEKHMTLKRSDGGVDSAFSLEPQEMKQLVIESKRAWESLGVVTYVSTKSEKKSMQFVRSIYINRNLSESHILEAGDLKIIRPGYGLAPKYWDEVLGRKLKKSVEKGIPLSWDLLY